MAETHKESLQVSLTRGDVGGLLEAVRYRVGTDLEVDEKAGMRRRYEEIEAKLEAALNFAPEAAA